MRRYLAIGCLGILAFTTHFTVRSLLVRASPSISVPVRLGSVELKPQLEASSNQRSMLKLAPGTLPRDRQNPVIAPSPNTRFTAYVRLDGVHEVGGMLLVAGRAELYDRENTVPYAWLVRVHEKNDEDVVYERLYVNEGFWIDPGMVAFASFLDVLPLGLERGDYVLELTVVDFAREFDLSSYYAARRTFSVD